MNTNNPANQAADCPVKPYTTKDLAALYGVSVSSMERWLKPVEKNLGPKNGWSYSVLQVEKIFSFFGPPF